MQFIIEGQPREFIPIKIFREKHQLVDDFGVVLFEPKDFVGLAVIDRAGSALNELREALLAAIPDDISLSNVLLCVDSLREMFRAGLHGSNQLIGLKPEEVEFAVSGFGDVLMNWAYHLIQSRGAPAEFSTVYHDWLQNSLRVSQTKHVYQHQLETWKIQIVNHAYGRMGLEVEMQAEQFYVFDGVYACPAQGYMQTLLSDMGQKIADNFV